RDSLWRSIGNPVVLDGVESLRPQVATWEWTVPGRLDPKRYCIATFVHSADSPLRETSPDLDEVTPRQRQVGLLAIGGGSCADVVLEIEALEFRIRLLWSQFHKVPHWERPAIEREILAAAAALNDARKRFEECLRSGHH